MKKIRLVSDAENVAHCSMPRYMISFSRKVSIRTNTCRYPELSGGPLHRAGPAADGGQRLVQVGAAPGGGRGVERRGQADALAARDLVQGTAGDACNAHMIRTHPNRTTPHLTPIVTSSAIV